MDDKLAARLDTMDYQAWVSRTFMGDLSDALGGLRRGRLMHSAAYGTAYEFSDLMEDSVDAGKLTEKQLYEIQCSNAVVRGVQDGETVYALAEIYLTVNQSDINRAAERAALLRQATGATAYPVVVGESVPPQQLAQAEEKGVTAIIVQDQRRY